MIPLIPLSPQAHRHHHGVRPSTRCRAPIARLLVVLTIVFGSLGGLLGGLLGGGLLGDASAEPAPAPASTPRPAPAAGLAGPGHLLAGLTSAIAQRVAGAVVHRAATGTGPGGIRANMAPPKPGPAYWLAGADGGVFAFGRARYSGGAAHAKLRAPVMAMGARPEGDGYWLVTRDGGVFAFGDAPFYGSAANAHLNRDIVGMAVTPSGLGYWLVGADGGVFGFGDAEYHGSAAGARLNAPIVGMAATPSGHGYWLVGRDGGVYAFGNAAFAGSVVGTTLRQAVVGMAATPSGVGYWLVAADGGVFAFGDAEYHGSAADAPIRRAAVGITPTRSGAGYWVAAADGGLFAFGDAGFFGSAGDSHTNGGVVGVVSAAGTEIPVAQVGVTGRSGWDVSWPQCGARLPEAGYSFGIVGVTGGKQFTANPCLADESSWAQRQGSASGLYANVNYPSPDEERSLPGLMGDTCQPSDHACHLRQWGARGAQHALAVAAAAHVRAPMWWLDVETTNHWSGDVVSNVLVVQGALDTFRAAGIRVGFYSTPLQWQVIVGGWAPGMPTWVAGPANAAEAPAACAPSAGFGGGPTYLVQVPQSGLDGNILCSPGAADAVGAFYAPPPPVVPTFPPERPKTPPVP